MICNQHRNLMLKWWTSENRYVLIVQDFRVFVLVGGNGFRMLCVF